MLGWLMGLEPNSAKTLLKPAPALTFAFSSRLKNMVKVDDMPSLAHLFGENGELGT